MPAANWMNDPFLELEAKFKSLSEEGQLLACCLFRLREDVQAILQREKIERVEPIKQEAESSIEEQQPQDLTARVPSRLVLPRDRGRHGVQGLQ